MNKTVRPPHPSVSPAEAGSLVSFARSGLTVHWDSQFHSLLELAEACDVPVRWACRTDVCHACESGLISSDVDYQPEPLTQPTADNLPICCPWPHDEITLDL